MSEQGRPDWLELGLSYLGTAEVKGAANNQIIVDFWKTIKQSGIKNDEIAWCAAFVGAVLERCRIPSTRSGMARSYGTWGQAQISPAVGSIVVFWRGHPKHHQGHVGFVVGRDQMGNLMVLGGNQADSVCIKPFSQSRVLSYRWPDGSPVANGLKFSDLPIIKSNGQVSENEA